MSGPLIPVLEARDLARSFGGVKAVDGVSFSVEAGNLVALIGPNGAGKTTCFNMLNGQLKPDRGEVLLAGRPITGLEPRKVWRLGVGRTFQITATFASMTVRENVQMALISHAGKSWRLFGRADRRRLEPADALLDQVGMAGQADRACGVLAYGDLKRVELVADPAAGGNGHQLSARGAFGKLDIAIENRPLATNPKSSEMTALGLVRLIENRVRTLVR